MCRWKLLQFVEGAWNSTQILWKSNLTQPELCLRSHSKWTRVCCKWRFRKRKEMLPRRTKSWSNSLQCLVGSRQHCVEAGEVLWRTPSFHECDRNQLTICCSLDLFRHDSLELWQESRGVKVLCKGRIPRFRTTTYQVSKGHCLINTRSIPRMPRGLRRIDQNCSERSPNSHNNG